ncbi:hypothetical protein DWV67_15955 [Dorea formicigenerans]|uniref:Uncharacterized protein n=1 Tax=Dorea formicigenerans TaxID=39486 RepID=A0A395XJJ3_9FIRM|nr:hypothetical protein DWV67_15955 [Dorea formicigenerans]
MNKKIKRIIPFILVAVLTSSFVMANYNKAREAKAAFVVDDIALMVALFAMCGITYTGLEYYYANGQWLDENDSPVADNDTQKQLDGLLDRSKKHWDEEVRKKAVAQGLIDEDGNILNNGSGGSSGDNNNDDNKFPSWDKLKEKVAKSGGNVALAVSSLLPFVALYGYGALEKSGADLADKLIDDGFNVDMDYITSNTVAYAYGKEFQLLNDYGDSVIIYSDSPACIYLDSPNHYPKLCLLKDAVSSLVIFKDGSFYKNSNTTAFYGYVNSYKNIRMYDVCGSLKSYYPTFNNFEDANDYLTNLSLDSSFNPVTIGQDSSLRDAMKENGDYPTSPIHSNVKLPSTDKLKELIKNLKSTADDNDARQNTVDDFIDDLTKSDDTGSENPNPTPTPNPNPDPSNPDSGDGSDNTGDSDIDKGSFVRDLRLVFPFCIPFDLIDCIRLFNAEPVTPKVELPIHFPIVNVDYTFTIDLKDFDGVAKICRSMFMILFMIGLVLATRPLIRG